MISNILDVWILGSVAEDLGHLRIHLLPHEIIALQIYIKNLAPHHECSAKIVPRSKGQVSERKARDKGREISVLTCRQQSEVARVEVVVEPAAAPVPSSIAPIEVANAEAAARAAVDRSPEEDRLAFPFLRNEDGISKEIIEDIRGQSHDELFHEFLAEFVTLDPLVASRLLLRKIEGFRLGFPVPFELTSVAGRDLLLKGQDRPAFGTERRRGAVDDMLHNVDLGVSTQERQDITAAIFALGERVEIRDFPASLGENDCEFVGKPTANI